MMHNKKEVTAMKTFDANYRLLEEMYQDEYYPDFLVDNALQEEFEEHDSEIETVARDCIGETVTYILDWFDIPIDTEEAIRERDW